MAKFECYYCGPLTEPCRHAEPEIAPRLARPPALEKYTELTWPAGTMCPRHPDGYVCVDCVRYRRPGEGTP